MEKGFLLKINGVGRAAVITVSLLTTLFFAAPRVSGDERTLSLKKAVAIALKDNHELEAFGYALSAEGGNVGIARSALPTWLHSMYWLIFVVPVGINLIIFGLTGFCAMANLLFKLGFKPRLQR